MHKKEQLTEVIRVRVSAREYKEIAEAAAKEQRTISDYIRLNMRKATLFSLVRRKP